MTEEEMPDIVRALFEALAGAEAPVEVEVEPSSAKVASQVVPGFFEVPSPDSSCDGCFFSGVVSMGECPVPRCLGFSRADNRDVWFQRL